MTDLAELNKLMRENRIVMKAAYICIVLAFISMFVFAFIPGEIDIILSFALFVSAMLAALTAKFINIKVTKIHREIMEAKNDGK